MNNDFDKIVENEILYSYQAPPPEQEFEIWEKIKF